MTRLWMCCLSVLFISDAGLAQPPPIRLYVYTAPSEFHDPNVTGRMDSIADLIDGLKKKKGLELVESAEQADVSIEILGRGNDSTGNFSAQTSHGTLAGVKLPAQSTATENKAYAIHAMLRTGSYELPLKAQMPTLRWRAVAKDLAGQIDKWVKDNRAQLIADRQ